MGWTALAPVVGVACKWGRAEWVRGQGLAGATSVCLHTATLHCCPSKATQTWPAGLSWLPNA